MDLGPHAFFILAAYAATAAILAGLVLRAALDHRAQVRALAELEVEGVPTTRELGQDILRSEEFLSGHYSTSFLEEMVERLPALSAG